MTEYTILRKVDHDNEFHWEREEGTFSASSPKRALSAAGVSSGIFIAVPARSWKELTVKSEQVTKVTIG